MQRWLVASCVTCLVVLKETLQEMVRCRNDFVRIVITMDVPNCIFLSKMLQRYCLVLTECTGNTPPVIAVGQITFLRELNNCPISPVRWYLFALHSIIFKLWNYYC